MKYDYHGTDPARVPRRRISRVPWIRGGRYSLADHIEYANNPNPPAGLGFDFSSLYNAAASVANTTIDTVAKARALKQRPAAPMVAARPRLPVPKKAPAPVLRKTPTPLWVWAALTIGGVVAGGVVISTLRQR